jgi:hypothetical protein
VLPVYRTRERLARMYTKNRSGSMSLSLRQNYQIAVKFPQRRSLASLGMRCQRTRSRSRIAGGSRVLRFEGSLYRIAGGRKDGTDAIRTRSFDQRIRRVGCRIQTDDGRARRVLGRLKGLIVDVEGASDRPKPTTEAEEDRRPATRTSFPVGSLV